MKSETKQLIQSSWEKIVPIADTAATLFYERLFDIDPEMRQYFSSTDMESQRKKLLQALAMVVNALNDLESILPQVESLGRRHVDYGVEDRHYDTVGAALIWTLEKGLGAEWNSEVRDAWTQAYSLVADVMKGAAAEVEPTNSSWGKLATAV